MEHAKHLVSPVEADRLETAGREYFNGNGHYCRRCHGIGKIEVLITLCTATGINEYRRLKNCNVCHGYGWFPIQTPHAKASAQPWAMFALGIALLFLAAGVAWATDELSKHQGLGESWAQH